MAQLGTGGELQSVKEEDMNRDGSWKAMPEGWYRFVLKDSEYKATSAGDGKCLHLTMICLDSQFQGQEKRDFLTLQHPKQETVQIAKARLKELAVAVGHPTPNQVTDSAQLHNIPFMARLYTQKARDPKYGDADGLQNKIGEYLACDDPRVAGGNGRSTSEQSSAPALGPDGNEIPF